MANPIKAVKAIGRAVGGITGKGSKQVNPVYRQSYRQKEVRIIGKGEKIEILIPKRFAHKHVAHRDGFNKNPHARKMGSGMDLVGMKMEVACIPMV